MKAVVAGMILCAAMVSWAGDVPPAAELRVFAIPEHGNLNLSVPEAWKADIRQPPRGLPPTITLYPAQGDDFKTLITVLWSVKNDPAFNKTENIKKLIERDLAEMLPTAMEKTVSLQEFKAQEGTGYYFLVTDRAPRSGEYPYAVRAGVGVGDLFMTVTVLCRSKDSVGIAGTIKALAGAQQKQD